MHDLPPPEAHPSLPGSGTVIGLDYGAARIGVAVAELELGIAHPVETIATAAEDQRARALQRVLTEWRPVLLVVGLPRHQDATPHRLDATIRLWARQLGEQHRLPVAFVDESFSSASASIALGDQGVRGMRQKRHLDSVAAQQILQGFLDDRRVLA